MLPHSTNPSQNGHALRAAIYTRVSTLEQGDHGHGLDAQLKDCRRLAVELDATIAAEYEDRDSGASWTLPGLNALLDSATRGEFELLICNDPDRLSRRMARYVIVEQELKKAGVSLRFVTIRAGDSPEDRALQQMKAVFAELDYERIIFRLARGKRTKAEKGFVVGTGLPPYGYRAVRDGRGRTNGLAPDPVTAPVVQRIFREVQSLSLKRLCQTLDADSVPTYFADRRSSGWYPATISGMLTNPVYLGTAPYGRRNGAQQWQPSDTWVYSTVPAIIDRATWDAAHAALDARKVFQRRAARSPEAEAAYPLRGLLRCAHCGGALQTAVNGVTNGMYRYYACLRNKPAHARRFGVAPCPLPVVPAEPLEQLAWTNVVDTLLDPDRMREGMAAARAEHEGEAGRLRGRVETLDAEAARLRTRLNRIVEEQLDAQAGSETARLLRDKAAHIEAALGRLATERSHLSASPAAGLSDADADSLAAFAADVRAGAEHATSLDQRRIFQLLKLTGAVRLDPVHGIKLKRRNKYSVEWDAVIQLRRKGQNIVNIMTIWIGPAEDAARAAPSSVAVE